MSRYIFILGWLVFSLGILFVLSLPDKNLHVIFCDVGQGDGALITYGTTQMVIDGGPDGSIMKCLGRFMPFWDRKIEVVLVTHPQDDHYGGIIDLVRSYQVETFIHPGAQSTNAGWKTLQEELEQRSITQKIVAKNDSIRFSTLRFEIYNPTPGYISKDINEESIVGQLSYHNFDVLFTGDVMLPIIDEVADYVRDVEVLKVPHHGSKNGLTEEFLQNSTPELAVMSLGKKNRYGHPHQDTLDLLSGIRTLRTDVDGTIEVISDGNKWWVKKHQ